MKEKEKQKNVKKEGEKGEERKGEGGGEKKRGKKERRDSPEPGMSALSHFEGGFPKV